MNTFNPGWFVIYTKPRHEKKVADQLEKTRISHFLPLVKRLRNWSDRRKYIDTPLFPSYIFVRLEDPQSYFTSLEIFGVIQYVRTGKKIAAVSEEVINNLRLIISNSPDEIEVSAENIYPGKKLFISEGPFTGFSCEVIQHKGKQKILVRIELLQRSILLDMPVEYLMPLSAMQEN
jgi:transcription antitermination factor NusG